jgi:hypothetical protein
LTISEDTESFFRQNTPLSALESELRRMNFGQIFPIRQVRLFERKQLPFFPPEAEIVRKITTKINGFAPEFIADPSFGRSSVNTHSGERTKRLKFLIKIIFC